jgi:hypothetical protein
VFWVELFPRHFTTAISSFPQMTRHLRKFVRIPSSGHSSNSVVELLMVHTLMHLFLMKMQLPIGTKRVDFQQMFLLRVHLICDFPIFLLGGREVPLMVESLPMHAIKALQFHLENSILEMLDFPSVTPFLSLIMVYGII